MSVQKIDYEDKIGLQNDPNVPDKNKVLDEDMNEIKSVVNNNADELTTAQQNIEDLQSGQGTASGDITSLKNRVTALETDNTTNKQDINTLKADNETNKQNIANKVDKVEGKGLSTEDFTAELKTKLEGLNNYDDTEIKEDIAEIQAEQATQNQKIEQLDDNQIHITTEKSSNINVQDCSGQNAKINVFGNSIQNGEPTPKAPVNIENVTGDIDITVCNKNLLPNNLESTTINGITATVNEDGSIHFKGTATGTATFNLFTSLPNFLKNDTSYRLSAGVSIPQNTYLRIGDNSNSSIFFGFGGGSSYLDFTYKNNFASNRMKGFFWFPSGCVGNSYDFTIYPMLVQGTDNEEYVKHEQQTITFPLAENQKMFKGSYTADNGIHHKRKQIELDGTENWVADSQASPSTVKGWKILVDDYVGHEGNFAPHGDILCSHFIDRNTYNNELDGISGGWGKWIYIKMKKEDLSSPDLTGFKAFLSEQKTNGTPVTIEYPLTEEEIEEYTEEQQEADNQLQNAKTYKTVTNVFTDNAEVEMNYIADTKTYIDNEINSIKEQINTINELLSTTNTSALLLNNLQTDLESEVL